MSLRVGTAAWAIPSAVRDVFPPGDSILARYAQAFDAVEINSSFYRPHRRATYARWADSVPADFRFAVKIPKAVTHEKRLVDADAEIERFLGEVEGLEKSSGRCSSKCRQPLAFDAGVAARFFGGLHARYGGRARLRAAPSLVVHRRG